MKNKQIIVNNINVSECENSIQGKHATLCASSYEDSSLCDVNKNCLYKKYKRKEQECAGLKSDLTDLSKTIDRKNGTILTFKEQLAQFKVKNYKYSLFIEELCDYAGLEYDSEEKAMRALSDLASQVNKDKYKQTLIKIKEIAETAAKGLYTTKSDDYTDGYRWLGDIILQKIKECGVE